MSSPIIIEGRVLSLLLQIGEFVGSLIAAKVLQLGDFGSKILAVGREDVKEGEDTALIESGSAFKAMTGALKAYASKAGEVAVLEDFWEGTSLEMQNFLPSFEREDIGPLLSKMGMDGFA